MRLVFEVTGGDLGLYDSAMHTPLLILLDWLALKREQQTNEIRMQAALHGARLKDDPATSAGVRSALNIPGMRFGQGRVKVSPEEMARRRALYNKE